MAETTAYYTIEEASDGRFYFILKGGNHEPMATSQMYDTKSKAERGIEDHREGAVTTKVVDNT